MTKLDPRLHAFRPDLADAALRSQVDAPRYVEPRRMQVIDPLVSLRKAPRCDAMQLTQALMGETVKVFAEEEGWAWAQLEADGYVGYVDGNALSTGIAEPTHRVVVPSSFLYPGPNLKTQPAAPVTMNARVTVVDADGAFAKLHNGRFVFAAHLQPVEAYAEDFVSVAEMFRHVPYYWGGKSVQGLDCSGLVQLSLEASGRTCLRDSDMQESSLGSAVPENDLDALRRGDLVFWDGHVGIMIDARTLLHANGHHMMTAAEPLKDAVGRIAARHGRITSIWRL